MPKADMHLHTLFSDGGLSPEELESVLYKKGVRFASITDHDTVTAFEGTGRVRFVSGIELSTFSGDSEVHLLGYGCDAADPGLKRLVEKVTDVRRERFERMLSSARALGLIKDDIPEEFADLRMPGRYHLALILRESGAAGTIREAFSRFLGEGCPLYEPVRYLETQAGLDALKSFGAFVSFAHPQRTNKDVIIKSLADNGLDAVEAYYPFHDSVIKRHYLNLAKKYNIICTGGSDYHKGVYSNDLCSEDITDFIDRVFS